MRTSSLAALAAFVTTVTAVPVSDLNKRYTGPNGQTQNTSAGGTGPNPSVSGDGGNGLTVTVIDPMGNTTIDKPAYRAITDFDYASFNLALHQEWIELDLFNYGLRRFSAAEFDEAGINQADRDLLQFMANQETGHAQLLTDILGPGAAQQCTYNYTGAFSTVREYVDFNQRLTRWGESGVWGFLAHLNSRDSANLLSQSIATEARQQMVFRQFAGASPFPVFFEPGIPQAWAWTLLAPYIAACPAANPRLGWSNYATLRVSNGSTLNRVGSQAAISTNTSRLAQNNQTVYFDWTPAGEALGPNKSYTTVSPGGSTPKFALFTHQLNATYAPLTLTSNTSGYATLPSGPIFNTTISPFAYPAISGTGFVALTSDNPVLTSYNFTLVLPSMVAGPAIFQAS